MDTKSLGIILTKMRERDKLVVEFLIRETKKNDKHR